MAKIRKFTDKEILERIESIGGIIPNRGKYLIVGLQSLENASNIFDDKFAVYDGPDFKMISSGTTNVGLTALKHFKDYGLIGAAVWKTDQFVKDCYIPGYHKGRMKALRQNKEIEYFRDFDLDDIAEEQGKLYKGIIWANMHGVDYDPFSTKIGTNINGWSFGCQVWNNMSDYRKMIKATWERNKPVDYCLLKEF